MEIFEKEKFSALKDQAKEYIQTRIDIVRLSAVKTGSLAAGNAVLVILLAVFGFFFVLFASIAGAFALSDWLDSRFGGFMIVGGIYLLLLIIFFAFRSQIVIGPVADAVVKAVLSKEDKADEKH